jgi:hypothetical protein
MSIWSSRSWRWVVVLTSAALFIVSLSQVAFVVDVSVSSDRLEPRDFRGAELLVSGWLGVLFGFNLLIFPSLIAAWVFACKKWPDAAAIAASLAVGVVSFTHPDSDGTSYYVAWLANPIIAVTWGLYLGNARPAAPISALLGLALTLSFLLVNAIAWVPKEGDSSLIVSYAIGYWLWVASASILVAGVSADVVFQRIINAPAKPPV